MVRCYVGDETFFHPDYCFAMISIMLLQQELICYVKISVWEVTQACY